MIFNSKWIAKEIKEKNLVENYIDLEKQITPNGFDICVGKIYKFINSGKVDFSNENRKLPETEELQWEGEIFLKKGFYKVKSRETLNMPDNAIAIARTRSTLLRCGAFTVTGVWDAGFRGKSEFLLSVGEKGIVLEKNSRIVQLIFFGMEKSGKIYEGIYKNLD